MSPYWGAFLGESFTGSERKEIDLCCIRSCRECNMMLGFSVAVVQVGGGGRLRQILSCAKVMSPAVDISSICWWPLKHV